MAEATIGTSRTTIEYDNYTFTFIDVGGSGKDEQNWKQYFGEIDGIVYVIDTFEKEYMTRSRRSLFQMIGSNKTTALPLLVFANKQDRFGALEVEKILEGFNLHTVRGRPWHLQGSSAKTGKGLAEGFEWLVGHLIKNEHAPLNFTSGVVDVSSEDKKVDSKEGGSTEGVA